MRPYTGERVARFLAFEHVGAALPIGLRLSGEMLGRGRIECLFQHGIARGILIHIRGPVADPLACDEDR